MSMTSPLHSCCINRWMGMWPVTQEVDWEHSHSASYWSAVAGAQAKGPWMEIWLGCGDKRTHWGQQVVYREAQLRNSITIHTSYWPVAYDPRPVQYAWYWVAMPKSDSFTFACCVSLVLLIQQQWIFTYLLTHLIGFTHCRHLNTHT